jgi:hypothetical protein
VQANRRLGSILNNDMNNILCVLSGIHTTPEQYKKAVLHLLDTKPGVLAQNVGGPDPVLYRSEVATVLDTYLIGEAAPFPIMARRPHIAEKAGCSEVPGSLPRRERRSCCRVSPGSKRTNQRLSRTRALSLRIFCAWRAVGTSVC